MDTKILAEKHRIILVTTQVRFTNQRNSRRDFTPRKQRNYEAEPRVEQDKDREILDLKKQLEQMEKDRN